MIFWKCHWETLNLQRLLHTIEIFKNLLKEYRSELQDQNTNSDEMQKHIADMLYDDKWCVQGSC